MKVDPLFNRVNLASPSCNQLCYDYWDGSSGYAGAFGTSSSTIGSGNYSPGIGPGGTVQRAVDVEADFLEAAGSYW
jgi:hypothetical protein